MMNNAVVTISGASAVAEGDSGTTTYVFTATLDLEVDGGFGLPVSTADGTATTADSDYDALSTVFDFAGTAGEAKTASVTINGDQVDEGDETFQIDFGAFTTTTLGSAMSVSPDPLTVTIQNDDSTLANISVDTNSISEEDTTIPVTVTLSNLSPVTVTVRLRHGRWHRYGRR